MRTDHGEHIIYGTSRRRDAQRGDRIIRKVGKEQGVFGVREAKKVSIRKDKCEQLLCQMLMRCPIN